MDIIEKIEEAILESIRFQSRRIGEVWVAYRDPEKLAEYRDRLLRNVNNYPYRVAVRFERQE